MLVGAVLATLVFLRPRLSLWIGLSFPAVQSFYSPQSLRLVVLSVLFVGLMLGWKQVSGRQRDFVAYLWFGVLTTLLIGWLLAADPSLAQGMVVNLLYATVVATMSVVFRMTAREWNLYVMAWGVVASIWLASHEVALTGRTGSLYIGENANALGMFAALGVVGALGVAAGRHLRVVRLLLAAPVAVLCAAGLVSSGSRGALLVAATGIAVHFAAPALRHSRRRAVGAVAVIAAGTYWIAVPLLTWFLGRAGRQIHATTNFDARKEIVQASVRAGVGHPLWGVGFGNLKVNDIGIFDTVSPHNAYVGLFAATGVIPVVLLAMLIVTALGKARSTREQNLLPILAAALVIGLSLDWIPTAKLGPLVFSLVACAAALSVPHTKQETDDRSDIAQLHRHEDSRFEYGR
jgi:O-antigen ligase